MFAVETFMIAGFHYLKNNNINVLFKFLTLKNMFIYPVYLYSKFLFLKCHIF